MKKILFVLVLISIIFSVDIIDSICAQTPKLKNNPPGTTKKIDLDIPVMPPFSAAVKGQAKDGNGNILDGVSVIVWQEGVMKSYTETDSEGNFVAYIKNPSGIYTVTAGKQDYVSNKIENITLPIGQVTKLDVTLTTSAILQGFVLNNPSTSVVKDATVIVWKASQQITYTVTDESGYYKIRQDIPSDIYTITVGAAGYIGYTQENVSLTAGVTTELSFSLNNSAIV